jgi:hypothetical protein
MKLLLQILIFLLESLLKGSIVHKSFLVCLPRNPSVLNGVKYLKSLAQESKFAALNDLEVLSADIGNAFADHTI